MNIKKDQSQINISKIESYKLNLPKIGKEKIEKGSLLVHVGTHKDSMLYGIRPDYKKFKSEPYNTEIACAAILVGFSAPNKLYKLYSHKMEEWESSYSSIEESLVAEIEEQRWIDAQEICGVLLDIRKMIDLGCVMEEIGKYSEPEPLPELKEYELFRRDRMFHSRSFLNWAQIKSFPIPDELKIRENEQGQIEYVDTVTFGDMEQTFPGHPKGNALADDPLYVAVKTREAFMNAEIKNPKSYGARALLTDWVEKNYPKISQNNIKHIVSLVNDGYGRGIRKI